MVRTVNHNIGDIQNRCQSHKTARNAAWKTVMQAVNSYCQGEPRTLSEVQKKYSATKSAVKRKLTAMKEEMSSTGGGRGSKDQLTPFETMVSEGLCLEEVDGVEGGEEAGLPSTS